MRGRNCVVCGVLFKDTIPGYPNPEAICDDCYSDSQRLKYAAIMARVDKTDSCGYCSAENLVSVKAHMEICSYRPCAAEIEKAMKRIGATMAGGKKR
jgi:hypothetical protein